LGRFFWNKRSKPDILRAIQEFEKAVTLDSGAAVAFAGLADCFVVAWDNGYIPPEEAYRQAKANATRALALDETLAEAHASLGAVYSFSLLWAAAEREYRRALELNPGYATAHQWYALNLSILGRHEEAVAEAKRSLSLDPLSPLQNVFLGQRLYYVGDYVAAINQLMLALELDPSFSPAHEILGRTYLEQGRYPEAVHEFRETNRLDGHVSGDLGYALALAGDNAGALGVLRELVELSSREYVPPKELALVHLGLRNQDRALDYLEKAYKEREGVVSEFVVDPRFVSISNNPRFQAVLRKSGLKFVATLHKGAESHG
jgi:tetratricopeptide (TPR) repeat protein